MTSRTRGWARAIGTLLGWLAAGATALACPICFQAEPNGTTDGVRSAVWVLLGVTSVVLGGFAVFIVRFAGHELGSGLVLQHRRHERERADKGDSHGLVSDDDAAIQDLTPRES